MNISEFCWHMLQPANGRVDGGEVWGEDDHTFLQYGIRYA